MSFRFLLLASLAVSAIAAVGPLVFRYEPMLTRSIFAGLWLAALWVLLLVIALFKYRRRGLWLLAGAPLALWTPFAVAAIYWACAYRHDCI